jgi:hypothetical protein
LGEFSSGGEEDDDYESDDRRDEIGKVEARHTVHGETSQKRTSIMPGEVGTKRYELIDAL